jgi:arabinofuranosyltransferase
LRIGRLRLPLRALLVALLAAPTVLVLVQGAGRYAQNVANVEDSDVAVARWLAPRLPPEAVLAVNDIGAIKYLLPNRIVDLVGIASPELRLETAAAVRAGVPWTEAMLAALEKRRPDYLVIFPEWFPGLAEDPRFRPLHVVTIPDNVTMGGDQLVVYATPWTRYPLREVPQAPQAPPAETPPVR